MQVYKREEGKEQPYWPLGPFKVRLPFIHYRWEMVEFVQAMIMFVVSLAMIPLLEKYLGLPYDVALAYVFVCGIGFMLPALLGVSHVPGWITPAIPVVLIYLGKFEPGPGAIKALVALQLEVFAIFFILGVTGLGSRIVRLIPSSLKAGILIGAGVAALIGEFKATGRVTKTPISLTIGGLICIYMLFSVSFKAMAQKNPMARIVAKYGMVPSMVIAMLVGWMVSEYPTPDIRFGFTQPAFGEMLNYLPITIGMPGLDLFLAAIPTAIIAYIIAFGDIVVGDALISRANADRPDEAIDYSADRLHLVTALRNLLHSFFAPYPGLAGPIWTAVTATTAERFRSDRTSMESIFSGAGTFWIAGFLALFILPLVTLFKPFLAIGLSLTLVITGYLCISIGMEQVENSTQRGVAGVVAVVLASYGAMYGLAAGIVLYLLVERQGLFKKEPAVCTQALQPEASEAG
jgi:xanthine/uracil/vitamin C permease (AzgA family)